MAISEMCQIRVPPEHYPALVRFMATYWPARKFTGEKKDHDLFMWVTCTKNTEHLVNAFIAGRQSVEEGYPLVGDRSQAVYAFAAGGAAVT